MSKTENKPEGILENVVTFLCFQSNPLSSRKLVKLVYLVDLYHQQMFGERLTDVAFKHYHYGAWSPEVEQCVEELCNKGILEEKVVKTSSGNQASIPKPAIPKTMINLPNTGLEVVKNVIDDWGDKSPDDVVRFTKNTVPFLLTPFDEEIDFTRNDAIVEYAKKKGISEEKAATNDVLLDTCLSDVLLKANKSLEKGGRLYTYDEVFVTS